MKWIIWIVVFIVILAYGLARYAMSTALTTENPVGFEIVQIADTDGRSFSAGVWYPTQARPKPTTMLSIILMDVARNAPISGHDLPLVIISHGNGGGSASHADLALALANAGYIVVAPMHRGDNYADQSAMSSADWLPQRNREIHTTIDFMLEDWQYHGRIDPKRIGAYGLSAGGFTVLTAVGGQPDLRMISRYCAPEFVCDLRQRWKALFCPT